MRLLQTLSIARRMSDCVSGHSFATSCPTEPDAVTGDPNRLLHLRHTLMISNN